MAKPKSEQLFKLIKSLSKSEKRAFKLFVSRYSVEGGEEGKLFYHLFDCIDKQELYDEEKIRAKIPKLKSSQVSNVKAHLYRQILKSLSVLLPGDSFDLKVTEKIDYARILYNKCLYRDCLKMIEKAKETAILNENRLLLLEILELEKMTIKQTIEENNEQRVNGIISESERAAATIQNINAFSNLSLKLSSFYHQIGFIRNKQDLVKVKNYFKKNLPAFRSKNLTVHELIYLNYAYCNYYYFIQDFKKGYSYAQKWINTFEQYPVMITRKPEIYIKSLNNLLVGQNKLNLYTDFYKTHRKLYNLKRNKKIVFTKNVNLNLFKTFYIHEINRHFMMGEFTKGTMVVSRLEKKLNNFIPLLDKHSVLIFYYKIACLYFGSGNFKVCLRWLNKIINEQVSGLREDLHVFARILRLIAYYELGDIGQVDVYLKSTRRFLLQKKHFSRYHSRLILFFNNIRNANTPMELKDHFIALKAGLKKLESDSFEKRAFIYFDIITWLESKIENKSVEEIYKNKRP